MSREAIKKLREQVQAGECTVYYASGAFPTDYAHAINAFSGSLDAAKALHESMLPGWWWNCANGNGKAHVQICEPGVSFLTGLTEDNPARAWLIAILKAMEEGTSQ